MNNGLPETGDVTVLSLLFLVAVVVFTWRLERRYALVPLLITTCYMPLGQEFVIAGLNFQFFRIVLLAGWCRVWFRGEMAGLNLTSIDKLFLIWALATLVMGTLTDLSLHRLINRSGEVYNVLGAFFIFRCWIRNLDEVIVALRFVALMIVPLTVSMIVEKFTGKNIFSVFGGVPEITEIRDGKLRCQGAFRHPILAGTYAATLFPLFVGLWFSGRANRGRALIGVISTVIATIASASSGPLLALLSALAGFALWPLKSRMRLVRWSMGLTIAGIAVMMNAPVWYLIARISEITGGSGWHRSYLIEQAINHFNEWWLVGSTYTAHWGPAGQVIAVDPNNMDITNHYVAEGLAGGIVKLGLFVVLIVKSFKTIGRWTCRPGAAAFPRQIMIWSLGVCLCAHCISFISVSYFDQIVLMWYWLLALVSMLAVRSVNPASKTSPAVRASNVFPSPCQSANPV